MRFVSPSHHLPGQARPVSQDRTATSLGATGPTEPFLPMDSGRFPVSERHKAQLNPCITPCKSCLAHLAGADFISPPSEAPSALVNQPGSTGYALNPCPPATGRTNTTDPRKTSVLHSVISRSLHPPPSRATRKSLARQGHIWWTRARVQKGGLDVSLEKRLIQNPNSSCEHSPAPQQPRLREVRKHLHSSKQQLLAGPASIRYWGHPSLILPKAFTPAA